jgi:hypothetical protein
MVYPSMHCWSPKLGGLIHASARFPVKGVQQAGGGTGASMQYTKLVVPVTILRLGNCFKHWHASKVGEVGSVGSIDISLLVIVW